MAHFSGEFQLIVHQSIALESLYDFAFESIGIIWIFWLLILIEVLERSEFKWGDQRKCKFVAWFLLLFDVTLYQSIALLTFYNFAFEFKTIKWKTWRQIYGKMTSGARVIFVTTKVIVKIPAAERFAGSK